jgi:hypothetical protein
VALLTLAVVFVLKHDEVIESIYYLLHFIAGLLFFEQICLIAGKANNAVGVLLAMVAVLLLFAQQGNLVYWPVVWVAPFLSVWAGVQAGRRLLKAWADLQSPTI